ncbi:MAG: L-histidine N(alpha)-methyltransferase [Cyclobacteriaceae bacterium]|nr:L-histidine N(alpha)-methyltransferase [Cyclobacteriaceae bacterium HetDA_MAG_MS6]
MTYAQTIREIATSKNFASDFEKDVYIGLSSQPKQLSSKYFYDERGDRIFQEIMHMDSYYLTRAELNIFQEQKDQILQEISEGGPFRILELGAGDGMKTKVLLKYFIEEEVDFTYSPVDISGHVLDLLEDDLNKTVPGLSISPLEGDYFKVLADISLQKEKKNVVFFLGSNIGNFSNDKAIGFLKKLRANLNKDDKIMIGFDLKKDPKVILEAYNDPDGITNRFNTNLLRRINEEMHADFDLGAFMHNPIYDPATGECKSFLISTKRQSVTIGKLNKVFEFRAWEAIYMEVSKKYGLEEIDELAKESGFERTTNFYDNDQLFVDSVWQAV